MKICSSGPFFLPSNWVLSNWPVRKGVSWTRRAVLLGQPQVELALIEVLEVGHATDPIAIDRGLRAALFEVRDHLIARGDFDLNEVDLLGRQRLLIGRRVGVGDQEVEELDLLVEREVRRRQRIVVGAVELVLELAQNLGLAVPLRAGVGDVAVRLLALVDLRLLGRVGELLLSVIVGELPLEDPVEGATQLLRDPLAQPRIGAAQHQIRIVLQRQAHGLEQ